jgi:polyisoprenyl-phosphate glycosyltransferase
MQRLSVITFFLNEARNLPQLKEQLLAALGPLGIEIEFILVDDHSTDASGEIAQAWVAEQPLARYIRLSRNCGSHAAISAGLEHSTGDCAVILAADLQDPPEIIPELIERWKEGNEVVWACRTMRIGESAATRAASSIYYKVMQWMAMPEMPAKGADFLLIDRKVVEACNSISEKHTSLLALILWMGFRQTSVEYVKQARGSGKSKWTLAKKLKLFVDSVVSFSYVPIRLMSLLGLLMAMSGFGYALVVVIGWLAGLVNAGTGFAALMTVLLVGQGCILVMLGVLGEYLWRTFDEARGRPKFIIEKYVASKGLSTNSHAEDNEDDSTSRDRRRLLGPEPDPELCGLPRNGTRRGL